MSRTSFRLPFAPLVALARMVVLNGGVHPRRLHVLIATMLRYTFFEPLRLAEIIFLDRKIESHRLARDPIFILGHWRSGTSYMQTLLGQDPKFTTSTLYRCLFADVFCMTERWLKPVLNSLLKALRLPFSLQRIPFDLDLPAEGDVALCAALSPFSSGWGHIFTKRFETWMDRSVLRPQPEFSKAWLNDYERFIRKLSWASDGKQVVMKSPGDTARVAQLLSRFPNARFVYIHRDPCDVFHSNKYLWDVIRREVSLQIVGDAEVSANIIETYRSLLQSYLEQRSLIPPGHLIEVRFEDLQSEPLTELTRIYKQLDLGELPMEVAQYLLAREPYPTTKYDFSLETSQALRVAWEFAFREWPPVHSEGVQMKKENAQVQTRSGSSSNVATTS